MKILIKNFLKSTYRDKYLLFWELIFPLAILIGVAIFVRNKPYSSYYIPGLLAFVLFQNLIFPIPYRIAQFKDNGVMKLVAEDGNILTFILSFLMSRIILVTAQTIIFLPLEIVIINYKVSINFIVILIAFIASIIGLGGLSLLAAGISKNVQCSLGWAQCFYFFFAAISGIFYPLENSPYFLQVISYISPVKYSRILFQNAFTNNFSINLFSIIFLIIFGVVSSVLAALLIKKGIRTSAIR